MRWPWQRKPVTLDDYHDADVIRPSDPAWEIFGRAMETGRAQIAERDATGKWNVRDLPGQ